MKRSRIIGFSLSTVVIGATATVAVFHTRNGKDGKDEKTETKRPNIILILTDDHTTQAMSCYGSKLVQTPNLDRIANEGMRFDNCYVSNAISGPSRACILTGKMSHINGFTDNSQTFDGSQETFPKLLQKNGYETAMIGKWHLNSLPEGFDFWSILIGQGEYYAPDFIENGVQIREKGYVTDIITDKAINFIKNHDADKPFALLYYHKAPHRNWMPAQRHLGIYDNTVFPEPETLVDDYSGLGTAAKEQLMEIGRDMWFDWDLKIATPDELNVAYEDLRGEDANKSDVERANKAETGIVQLRAAYDRMTAEEKENWNKAYRPRIDEFRSKKMPEKEILSWKYQQYMRDYLATALAVDENVGRLLKYLEDTGELDNTIIIYSSDQGFFIGEHGWFDKRFMYEESQRTPLLIRYPKCIKAGSMTSALSMNIDFAPTLLDYAHVPVPKEMQGCSLKPILENEGKTPQDWRKAVYYHYYEYPSWHSVKRHYGIRTDRYKLIHFYNDIDEWELYDLQGRTTERKNVINDPAYVTVKKEMMQLLDEARKEYKDTSL
jgi:arylsulfatase A-like enzyme